MPELTSVVEPSACSVTVAVPTKEPLPTVIVTEPLMSPVMTASLDSRTPVATTESPVNWKVPDTCADQLSASV